MIHGESPGATLQASNTAITLGCSAHLKIQGMDFLVPLGFTAKCFPFSGIIGGYALGE